MKKNKKNCRETKKKCDFSAKLRQFIEMKKRTPHDCIDAENAIVRKTDACHRGES